jgi:hypothetical protein
MYQYVKKLKCFRNRKDTKTKVNKLRLQLQWKANNKRRSLQTAEITCQYFLEAS